MFIKNLISRFSKIIKTLCIISCFIGISEPARAETLEDFKNWVNAQIEGAKEVFAEKQQWVNRTLGITSENSDAVKAEYDGTTYLSGVETLTGADKALDTAIKNNAEDIDSETARAKDAENALDNKIDAETARAKDAENALDNKIDAETARSTIADALLGVAIAGESIARQQADEEIDNKFYSGEEDVNFNTVTTNSITLDGKEVTGIDDGTTAVTEDTADGETLATTATVIRSAENGIYTNNVDASATNIESTTTTINGAIADLDTSIGNRNINSANTEINNSLANSVSEAIATTGNLIGNMDFSNAHYVSDGDNITSAINKLDANLNAVDTSVQNLGHHVDHVENHLRGGIAATAALTALVPNARDCSNTQISVGSGNYANKVGFAAGLFHYFSDRILVNGGASYATSNDWAFRAGITIGL